MREEIEKWRSEMGFNFLSIPKEDPLKNAIVLTSGEAENLNASELDSILLILTSYYSYLQSQIGILDARVLYLEEMLNSKVSIISHKFSAPHANERRALAISKDKSLTELNTKLIEERAKVLMVRPIIDSIKIKIYAIEKIYNRKAREVEHRR